MPGGRTITRAVSALTGIGILLLVILHPQVPLKLISTITNTVTGTLNLAKAPGIST